MSEKTLEFITLPKTFEKYKWYKPILVFIISAIIFIIFSIILTGIFEICFGENMIANIVNGGYESMNTELGDIFSNLSVIIMIPSLYLGTKIVKDRPFSSYISSQGKWNIKLYLKAMVIPFVIFMVLGVIDASMNGFSGSYHFSIWFLIITLICVPLQCIAEELVYRGLIMQTFGAWLNIPILAVILQSIFFGFSHGYNSIGNIEIIVSGLVMGFLAWKTNGIEVSSAFHTATNLSIGLLVMFGLQSTSSTVTLEDAATAIISILVICAIMYFVGKKTNWYGEIPENT